MIKGLGDNKGNLCRVVKLETSLDDIAVVSLFFQYRVDQKPNFVMRWIGGG